MIPTLLVLGFVAGLVPRGWIAVPAAAVGWPLLLMAAESESGAGFALAAAALATANTAVGVLPGYSACRLVVPHAP